MNIKLAFTLAEVLIVLGIIGLIADMTIPTLISSTQEKVAVARLQKAYSTFESAFRLAVAEDGTPDNWGFTGNSIGNDREGAKIIFEHLAPYLKVLKNCEDVKDCFPAKYKLLNNGTSSVGNGRYSFQLADGTSVLVGAMSGDCSMNGGDTLALQHVCGNLGIDINGFQNPNTFGRDYFYFQITKYGIIPIGTSAEIGTIPGGGNFSAACIGKGATGTACAAWVIYNGNMDYLHCSDLSWEGKHSCK